MELENSEQVKDLVSVIIPAFNSANFLVESTESALKQTYNKKEIIIIDDGSTDETRRILDPYIERGEISYFFKQNGGPASARNLGMKKSKGEFIAFLDADDLWEKGKLKLQIDLFRRNSTLDVIFGIYDDGQQNIRAQGETSIFRLKDGYIFDELLTGNFIVTSTVMLRKEVIERFGLFDEDKKLISVEDINLWIRLARKCRFGFINEILSKRRLHEMSLTENFEKMYTADVYNFNKLANTYPEWRLRENKSFFDGLANYYYQFGDCYFYRGDYKKARTMLLKAIRHKIVNTKAWLRILLTLCPFGCTDLLRSLSAQWTKFSKKRFCKGQGDHTEFY
jgi:glycosyltransferase involved in cell wall biosynthesis